MEIYFAETEIGAIFFYLVNNIKGKYNIPAERGKLMSICFGVLGHHQQKI